MVLSTRSLREASYNIYHSLLHIMTNDELIHEAMTVINPKTIDNADMGGVGCALLTSQGTVFKGVCIDTICSMGFCAEHNAIGSMITAQEYDIQKIVAVKKNDKGEMFILPPCGRCREFIYQINKRNSETEIILDKNKTEKLKNLLPYYN